MVPGNSRCFVSDQRATLLKPLVQFCQIGEDLHDLPQAAARIPNVLLDLPFLPASCRIAELNLKDVVAGHGLEAGIDIALFASSHAVH